MLKPFVGCDTGFGNQLARRLDVLGFAVLAGCLDANGDAARKLVVETSQVETVQIDVTSDVQVKSAMEHVTLRTRDKGTSIHHANHEFYSNLEAHYFCIAFSRPNG